jgi:hypothetical protein
VNFTVHEVAQRSPEWFALRVGLLTGSCAGAVIQERKRGTGELAVRRDLRKRMVCERLTGLGVDDVPYLPHYMQRGADLEPAAFAAYEAQTGLVVNSVGFVSHLTLKAGCSPDGQVGGFAGIVELKCPKSATHLDYFMAPDTLRQEYFGQALHAIWLTGAAWCDVCSFDDRFKPELELVRVRVDRASLDLVAYELAVNLFLSEVDAEVEKVQAAAAAGVAA